MPTRRKESQVAPEAAGSVPALDELYEGPLAAFVQRRETLARELKRAGRDKDAALVKGAGKPTASAHAVNRAVRANREALEALLEATDAVARAQASAAGTNEGRHAYKNALADQRRRIEDLVTLAGRQLQAEAQTASPALLDRVAASLREGAATEPGRAALREARLTRDLALADLGTVLGALPNPAPLAAPASTRRPATPPARRREADGSAAPRKDADRAAPVRRDDSGGVGTPRRGDERAAKEAEARAAREAVAALSRARESEARAARALGEATREHQRLERALADSKARLTAAAAAHHEAVRERKDREDQARGAERRGRNAELR